MTTDLEKQFFDTFGIKPKNRFKGCKLGIKYYSEICDKPTCKGCDDEIRETEYPQITDRILLKLICILNSVSVELKSECIKDLKQEILGETKILFEYAPNEETGEFIKHQVRTLFEEG